MKAIGEIDPSDVSLLSVGDRFTMGSKVGVMVAKAVGASLVIPQHWETFPVLAQDMGAFISDVEKTGMQGHLTEPGKELKFVGNRPQL